MLLGWVIFELVVLAMCVGMVFPRLAIPLPRIRRRREPKPPPTRRRRILTAVCGAIGIALILGDWSGLSLGWQSHITTTTSGAMSTDRAKLIDDLVTPAIKSGKHIGLIVGVVDRGRTWTRGYGRKSVSSLEPPGADSIFEIGSITKTFTCAALASMSLSGDVRLIDPVSDYLPKSVRVPSRQDRQITLLDLATQTSGLPRVPTNMSTMDAIGDDPYSGYTAEDAYEFLSGHTLTHTPGEVYEYSNFGMGLLGLALARKSRMGYEKMINKLVCRPLGMNDTAVTLSPSQESRLVPGYAMQEKHGRLLLAVSAENWTFQDATAGAGALKSTATDMLKYLQANIEAGDAGLGPALAMTHKVRHKTDDDLIEIGLGWHTFKVPWSNEPIIWHNGGTAGYRSWAGFCPRRKLGVVVLSNSDGDVDILALRVMKAMLAAK